MTIHNDGYKELEKILAYDNYEYIKKLDYDIINKNEIYQESLRSEYKEALELYMKKSVKLLPQSKQP